MTFIKSIQQIKTLLAESKLVHNFYRSICGRSIRKALDWIVAHAFGEGEWTYQNLKPISPGSILPVVWRAHGVYGEDAYGAVFEELSGGDWPKGRDALLYAAE